VEILLITTPFLPLNSFEIKQLPLHKQERTSVSPPLGVCYLSSYLRQRGYRVSILDLDLEIFTLIKRGISYTILDIIRLIKDKGFFDIIGISALTSERYKRAHQLAAIADSLDATVIMGGNYPTNSPEMALSDPNVNYIVMGEGEEIFYKLLRAIEEDVGLEELTGIGYEDMIRPRVYSDFIQDLDTLPFPDYGNIDVERYHDLGMSQSWIGNNKSFTLFTSRGCPNHCIYCCSHNTFGYKTRYRSVDNVLSEVNWLVDKYGADEILIQDDNFTKDKKRACEILDRLKIRWAIPNGLEVNSLDREILEKAKASGVQDLTLAIETGSPRIQKLIKKNVNLDKAKEIIGIMRELRIYSKVFYMLGFPGETKEEIQQTIDYASKLKADWSIFSIVNSLPGTELAKKVKPDFDNIGYANANISTEDFNAEYIEKKVGEANIKINFIENYNLNGGNIDYAIRDFQRIAQRYPQHTIARESLRRALFEKSLCNR